MPIIITVNIDNNDNIIDLGRKNGGPSLGGIRIGFNVCDIRHKVSPVKSTNKSDTKSYGVVHLF